MSIDKFDINNDTILKATSQLSFEQVPLFQRNTRYPNYYEWVNAASFC